MINQVLTGTPTNRRFAACPTTVKAGDIVLLGALPAVALDNYQANEGGTTFLVNGSFSLTVIGQSSESPVVGHTIKPGDKLYGTGTLDAPTNVTTGLTIDANSSNTFIGYLDPNFNVTVLTGTTNTAAPVMLATGA
jgi:predicted RecA/RadA family phage recombinase